MSIKNAGELVQNLFLVVARKVALGDANVLKLAFVPVMQGEVCTKS